MDTFNYIFEFKSRNINQVDDALSRQTELLMTLKIELQGLDNLKDQYLTDIDFADIWKKCMKMILYWIVILQWRMIEGGMIMKSILHLKFQLSRIMMFLCISRVCDG